MERHMTLQDEIKRAAAELQRLLNLFPSQLEVEIDKHAIAFMTGDSRSVFEIRIVSTPQPVQIYP